MAEPEFRPRYAVTDDDLATLIANYPDIAKSLGVGAARGAVNIAGFVGDTAEAGAQGLDAAVTGVGNLFGQDWRRSTLRPQGRPLGSSPIGSEAIQRGVEGYTGEFFAGLASKHYG
jgi:hypothetical protein